MCSCNWKGFHGEISPGAPKLGQTKAQSSPLGIQLKVLTVLFFLKWDSSQLFQWANPSQSRTIRLFLGLQRVSLVSTWNPWIGGILIKVLCVGTEISIYLVSQYQSSYSSVANSHIYKIPMNPSNFCFVNEEECLISTVATGPEAPQSTVHFLQLISIFLTIFVELCVNWGLADWFSFLTGAVERQFNFFSSLPPGRLFFYFCASLSKNVNMTLSALSTFSAVTDITWPQFMRGTEETHSSSTIWIYYHLKMSRIQQLRIILKDELEIQAAFT